MLTAARTTTQPQPATRSARTDALALSVAQMGAPMLYARNTEIYGEGEDAEYVYQVVSGAVRTYKILNDGRRQIGAFYLPGDVFGLEIGDEHELSAEAICNCTISVIKRASLAGLAGRDHGVAHALWTLTARELQRAQKHVLLLVAHCAGAGRIVPARDGGSHCGCRARSNCRCRDRTSPTISALPSRPCHEP